MRCRSCNSGRGGTFGLCDGVDGQAHEGTLKFGRGQGSGLRGEFEHPASEGKEFDRNIRLENAASDRSQQPPNQPRIFKSR